MMTTLQLLGNSCNLPCAYFEVFRIIDDFTSLERLSVGCHKCLIVVDQAVSFDKQVVGNNVYAQTNSHEQRKL